MEWEVDDDGSAAEALESKSSGMAAAVEADFRGKFGDGGSAAAALEP